MLTVAYENMGTIATPDGTCAGTAGVACWAAAIPATPPDPSQFDNDHGGTGFMMASLDFNRFAGLRPTGDNRMAVFDGTGLRLLNSPGCIACGGIPFGGQLFSGVLPYNQPGAFAAQKTGPIPLGDMCGETHQGIVYWVVGTNGFDRTGTFSLTGQGYATAAHEDLDMPAIAASGRPFQDGGNGTAVITLTLTGDGGPTGADNGGFFPSTAYGGLSTSSGGLWVIMTALASTRAVAGCSGQRNA